MKKTTPVLFFLMLLLLSPNMSWAADESDVGGSSESSAEQGQDQDKVASDKAKKAKKEGKKPEKGDEEEPDCE